jgi:uncharacterized protein (TIGR03086 family)
MSPADRYRRLARRFTDVVDAVPDDSWHHPSPCEGWSARDVVAHVVTTELEFLGRMPFAPAEPPVDAASDPVRAWPVVRDLFQVALDTPAHAGHTYDGFFGPTTFEASADEFYAADLVVHAWDIARATGLTEFQTVDPEEIDRLMGAYGADSPIAAAMRQPGIFGAAIESAPDADPTTRLMNWLGRHA